MERRKFLKKGSFAAGALSSASMIAACGSTSTDKEVTQAVPTNNKTYEWRCVTTWPPNFPVLGEGVVNMCKELEIMSAGRLKIKVYGSGELVPGLEVFDAVTQGAVQMGHGSGYYWQGKIPSAVFFSTVPFGLTAQQMNAWMYFGGGMELWNEIYGKFDLKAFPCGNTGVQMGGWFNKEINTIEDLQGIKMRIPGLGGKAFAKAGGSAITVAGGEIYTNLERGVIDATEWIGPFHDYTMGFHKVAKYYYYPGWHEPGTVLELMVNKTAYESLPKDLQQMIDAAAAKYNLLCVSELEAKNSAYLSKIKNETDADIRHFPVDVLNTLKKYTEEVIQEIVDRDEHAKKVYANLKQFKEQMAAWSKLTEGAITPFL